MLQPVVPFVRPAGRRSVALPLLQRRGDDHTLDSATQMEIGDLDEEAMLRHPDV